MIEKLRTQGVYKEQILNIFGFYWRIEYKRKQQVYLDVENNFDIYSFFVDEVRNRIFLDLLVL